MQEINLFAKYVEYDADVSFQITFNGHCGKEEDVLIKKEKIWSRTLARLEKESLEVLDENGMSGD